MVCPANIFPLSLFYVPCSCFLAQLVIFPSMFPLNLSGTTWWQWVLSLFQLCLWPNNSTSSLLALISLRSEGLSLTTCVHHEQDAKFWINTPVFAPLIVNPTPPCSHLGRWCNETAHVTTQLSWDPQPWANWRMHMQPLINPIPKAVCLQTWAALCKQHNEVYLYRTVIHDSLGWCWTLSK